MEPITDDAPPSERQAQVDRGERQRQENVRRLEPIAPGRLTGIRDKAAALFSDRNITVSITILIVAYLTITPLFYLLRDTFSDEAGATLDAFRRAYAPEQEAGAMLLNSLTFSIGSAALALLLGTAVAYVQVRTDAPFKGLLFAAALIPMILPALLYALAWIFLAAPGMGLINTTIIEPLFGGELNIFSVAGMIWIEGTHLSPLAFLLMVGAFRSIDPSAEEAALMSGARWSTVLRTITLPLLRPALLSAFLMMFTYALASFEVPAMIGLSTGKYVLTSRMYFVMRTISPDYGAAGAYAITLLLLAVAGVLLSNWLNRNARSYQTITGKAFRPRLIRLGRFRYLVGGITVAYFTITVALPGAIIAYASLLPYYAGPSLESLQLASLENYLSVLTDPMALRVTRNSLLLAAASATMIMLLSVVAAWFVVRTRGFGRKIVNALMFTPIAIPGLVMGLALLFVYLRVPLPIYGTLWILLIAYITRFLPYGMQYASVAMTQISGEVEESAMMSGARWLATFRRILLPLTSAGIVTGWIFIFMLAVRELTTSILISSPGNEVLAIYMWERYSDGSVTKLSAIGTMLIILLTVIALIVYRLGGAIGLERDTRSSVN